jgi:hypothetical protein
MRRAARIDANQTAVTKALRDAGMTVAVTSSLGKGFPDLVVGFRGLTCLVELKDGAKPPSAQKLTADEQQFADSWAGHLCKAGSAEEIIEEVLDHAAEMGRI